ncbi:unnamed protein product [Bemisia tabaci]|uniref:Sushi domain-containing protein n=1 Tax=Bemisia tabaci TaxID=7038 RepID=A0A9P0ABF7_BEMTA|nr:unnamed protein product [Bemisia tabaci]
MAERSLIYPWLISILQSSVFILFLHGQTSGDDTSYSAVVDLGKEHIQGNSSKCGFFGPIENGKIELSAYDENEVRQFYTVSCHPGFELNGPSRLVCEKGVWVNSSWPYCVQKCVAPEMIMNGAVAIDGRSKEDGFFLPNAKAHYMCQDGFFLSPSISKERQCINGSWSGRTPVCIRTQCNPPEPLENGYLLDRHHKNGVYSNGDIILYGCEEGFTLEGYSASVCNGEGEWTPSANRKCVSKIEVEFKSKLAEAPVCPPPPNIPFVKFTRVEGMQIANNVLSGSMFQAHCQPGYQNVLSPCVPAIFTCNNGVWKGEIPKCEKVTSCVEPVSMSQNGLRFNVPLGTEMSGSFRIGSKVIYDCLPGYILHGEAVLTCSKSGCWEPNALPKCLPQAQLLPTFNGRPVDYVSGTLLVTLLTAVTILLVLLGICLVSMRQRAPPPAITTVPPPTLLQSHPDRLALIAFTDAVQVGQSGLPSYEEATRDRFSHRFHRPPHWTQPSRRAVTRQPSSVGGDSMGSTDTMTNDSNSTNVTLDTVSSHSGSQTASCRAICGSLASFDTSSVINTEGVPLLEESEQEENAIKDNESGSFKSAQRVSPELT